MKNYFAIGFLLFLLCCSKSDIDELLKNSPVLSGVLVGGQKPDGISYIELPSAENGIPKPRIASIRILSENNDEVLLDFNGSDYYSNEDFVFQNDKTYRMNVSDEAAQNSATVTVRIPPAIDLVSLDNDTVHVEEIGNLACLAEWTALDIAQYSYVLKLENIEKTKVELPIEGGLFSSRYTGPQLEAFFQLKKSDFSYYGQHRLTVYAIERDFESVFFFDASDLRGLLRNGPDNVYGGNGFVAGVSSFSVDFVVID